MTARWRPDLPLNRRAIPIGFRLSLWVPPPAHRVCISTCAPSVFAGWGWRSEAAVAAELSAHTALGRGCWNGDVKKWWALQIFLSHTPLQALLPATECWHNGDAFILTPRSLHDKSLCCHVSYQSSLCVLKKMRYKIFLCCWVAWVHSLIPLLLWPFEFSFHQNIQA